MERSAAAEHRESFVFEELHTPAHPRLVRLKNAEASPTCEPAPSVCDDAQKLTDPGTLTVWEFMTGPAADIAADLLGPDLKFHHAKLNYKWHSGGEVVSWHQVTRRLLVT